MCECLYLCNIVLGYVGVLCSVLLCMSAMLWYVCRLGVYVGFVRKVVCVCRRLRAM